MRIAFLTTDTLHHAHFLREVAEAFPIGLVLNETSIPTPPFETAHAFETKRDMLEREAWFEGKDPKLLDFAPTHDVDTVNSAESKQLLRGYNPDVVVVFGTGKICPEVIDLCPDRMINLHGGDPEYYRGLDSHLWAIYHADFANLVTTLHHVNSRLDDGDIIAKQSLATYDGMPIEALRKINTEACISLTLTGLGMMERFGRFNSTRQYKKGRYYSFMPTELKTICVEKFSKHFG